MHGSVITVRMEAVTNRVMIPHTPDLGKPNGVASARSSCPLGWRNARRPSDKLPATAAQTARAPREFIQQSGVSIWQRGPELSRCGSRLGPRETTAFLVPQAGSRAATATATSTLPGAAGPGFPKPPSDALPPLSRASESRDGDGIGHLLRGMAKVVRAPPASAMTAHDGEYVQLASPRTFGSGPGTAVGTAVGGLPEPIPPPSIVPREYHVTDSVAAAPDGSGVYASEWHEQEGQWRVTIFPAQRPIGREQVGHLRTCLNQMIEAQTNMSKARSPRLRNMMSGRSSTLLDVLESDPLNVEGTYRQLHSIYAAGMHELARQVSANCAERGQLLINVWSSVEALRERMFEMHKAKADAAVERQVKVDEERIEALAKLRSLEPLYQRQRAKASRLGEAVQSLKEELTDVKVKAAKAAREGNDAADDREAAKAKAVREETEVLRLERDAMKALADQTATERDELQKQLDSRGTLVAMLRTLQAALKSVEEQLANSQLSRKHAEAQLSESRDSERRLRKQLETVVGEQSSSKLDGNPAAVVAGERHEEGSLAPSGVASRKQNEVA